MVFHSFGQFLLDISGHVTPYPAFAYLRGYLVAGIFYRKCTCTGLFADKTNVFSYGTDSLHDAGSGHMGSDVGVIKTGGLDSVLVSCADTSRQARMSYVHSSELMKLY